MPAMTNHAEVREAQLQALLDKEALYELAVRYARAIDRRDRALLLSVYHEDAIDDHGVMFKGDATAYANWQPEVMAPFEVTAHYIMNKSYRLDGDRAQGELYFIAYHRTKAPDAKEVMVGGRYLDRYERRANVWKIVHRTLVWDFTRENPLDPAQRDFLASLGKLGCGADDVSFSALPLFSR